MPKRPSPLSDLQAAERNYFAAQESCPHWDYAHDGADHQCCVALDEARIARQKAQKVYNKVST